MSRPGLGTCCSCDDQVGGIGTCAKYNTAINLPDCPASVTVTGTFSFQYRSSGGSARGCLDMIGTPAPLWSRLREGEITITSKLYRTKCNGSSPWIISYQAPAGEGGGCTATSNATCGGPGCRSYGARDVSGPDCGDAGIYNDSGVEITSALCLGLPLVWERTSMCQDRNYYNCAWQHAGCLPGSYPDDYIQACNTTWSCNSASYSCPKCEFEISEVPIFPHLRCHFPVATCYSVRDPYNNCADIWIHVVAPQIVTGKFRDGDPVVSGGFGGTSPLGTSITAPTNPSFVPTWAKKITVEPACIPAGTYEMFALNGAGITPSETFNCNNTQCFGTDINDDILIYSNASEDLTLPFNVCESYWIHTTIPCVDLFEYDVDLPLGIGPACATPQCCYRGGTYQVNCVWAGTPDPPICISQSGDDTTSGLDDKTGVNTNDLDSLGCGVRYGRFWSADTTPVDHDFGYYCCGEGVCEYTGDEGLPCGLGPGPAAVYGCTEDACTVSNKPSGYQNFNAIVIQRPFPPSVTLSWDSA